MVFRYLCSVIAYVHDEQSPVFFQGVMKVSAAGQQTLAGTVKVKIEGRGNYKSNMTAQYQILPPVSCILQGSWSSAMHLFGS